MECTIAITTLQDSRHSTRKAHGKVSIMEFVETRRNVLIVESKKDTVLEYYFDNFEVLPKVYFDENQDKEVFSCFLSIKKLLSLSLS
jgi:hypothetical protein